MGRQTRSIGRRICGELSNRELHRRRDRGLHGDVTREAEPDGHGVLAGGDEFAVLFPGAPLLVAERAMRRLAESIADGRVADGKGLPTIAWGVADAATRTFTVDELVDAADRAMYRQKQKMRARLPA